MGKMRYSMTVREAIEAGIVLESILFEGGKPVVELVEVYQEGSIARYRYITTSVPCSLDAFEKWRAKWRASKELKCERCNYQWVSILTAGRPRSCPACKSPYWDRPRRSRSAEKITPIIVERCGKLYRSEYVCRICSISWPKDTEVLNVECPQCRRKCGATSRQVELSAEDAKGLAVVEEEEPLSFDEFRRQEEKVTSGL